MPLSQYLKGKLKNYRSFLRTKMILNNYSWLNPYSLPSFSLQERLLLRVEQYKVIVYGA